MADDWISMVRSVPLFSDFGDKDLQRISEISKQVEFSPGKEIARQGDAGLGFHMIMAGEVEVDVDGTTRATLGPGSYFGEMSLLDGGPRSATVRAVSPVRTISMASWDFHAMLDKHPELAKKLLIELSRRLRSIERRETH
jgi:CRP/FNR family cyclic AMP-dependent transcriptional regulator